MSIFSLYKFSQGLQKTEVPAEQNKYHATKSTKPNLRKFLTSGARQRQVVSFTLQQIYSSGKNLWCPLCIRPGEIHSQFGCGSQETSSGLARNQTMGIQLF
jgi:hypothetical protein